MMLRNLGRISVLLALLCGSAIFASAAGTGPNCNCVGGDCVCQTCLDSQHYTGFCAGINCTSGSPCCPIATCGKCNCKTRVAPLSCLADINGCTIDGCPFAPSVVESVDANNHLQPWMVDETLPTQLAVFSKTWFSRNPSTGFEQYDCSACLATQTVIT